MIERSLSKSARPHQLARTKAIRCDEINQFDFTSPAPVDLLCMPFSGSRNRSQAFTNTYSTCYRPL